MNKLITIAIFIALSSLALADPPPSNNYSIRSSVFGNSSATTGGDNYMIKSTVGEPISAASSTSTNFKIKSGFWYTLQSLDVPGLVDPLAYEITGSSASFSVVGSANGSSTTFGFEYGETSGVYTQTFSAEEGDIVINSPLTSSSATITGSITGLDPETTYYIRGFGLNSTGSNTSTEATFTTLSPEPLSHSEFSQEGEGLTSITFTHDRADDNAIQAEGYIIIRKATAFNNDDYPEDGTYYSVNDAIGDATVVAVIEDASSTQSIVENLQMERSWQFVLIPFNTNEAQTSTNYLITDAPEIKGYTIPTLGEWLLLFGGTLLVAGVWQVRRVV
jgi:hypothetical protein